MNKKVLTIFTALLLAVVPFGGALAHHEGPPGGPSSGQGPGGPKGPEGPKGPGGPPQVAPTPTTPTTPLPANGLPYTEPLGHVVEGTVNSFDYGKHGELKGLYLTANDGSLVEVEVDDDEAGAVTALVSPGSRIQAIGELEIKKHGERELEAWTLTNLDNGQSLTLEESPFYVEPSETRQGIVHSVEYGKHGEIKGLWLDVNGAWLEIDFPKHEGQRVLAIAPVGGSIEVMGEYDVKRHGEQEIDAWTITNLNSGESITIDGPDYQPNPTTVTGTVNSLEYGKHGEVKGFWIATSDSPWLEVDFHDAYGGNIAALVVAGMNVEITGELEVESDGEREINAWQITDTGSGQTITMPVD